MNYRCLARGFGSAVEVVVARGYPRWAGLIVSDDRPELLISKRKKSLGVPGSTSRVLCWGYMNNLGQKPIKCRLLVIYHHFMHWLLRNRENWFSKNLIFKGKLYIFFYQTLASGDILLLLDLCENVFWNTTTFSEWWRKLLLGSWWQYDSVKAYVRSRTVVQNVTLWLLWALRQEN